jgi:hypothetical protein
MARWSGGILKTKPGVHIYTLSRLVHAPAAGWERRIQEIEKGRLKAYGYYQPMREAVVSYCAAGGTGRDRIVARMLVETRRQPRARGQDPERDNLSAFEIFETSCYPKIAKFVQGLLRKPQGPGVPFEGVFLFGTPHLEVTDKNGKVRYVFLQSSDWKDDDVKAYLELLAVVVENGFGDPAGSIWHMNLRTGRLALHRSSKRVRRRCADAARHYGRIFGTDAVA